MYLSKLILNLRNAAARRDAAVPYELHRTLMRCVGDTPADERLLYRIEPEMHAAGPVVLVQTRQALPDWDPFIENQYLLYAEGPKSLEPLFEKGDRLRFRLTANPVKKQKGKRIPLIFAEHDDAHITTYYDWLGRQAGRSGFRLLGVRDAPFRLASNRRKQSVYGKQEIPHFGVRFDGALEVTQPELLISALRSGIGPAKSFGFGLLSVSRL